MNFSETVKIALTAIRANKLRSVLTLLGIVVGVFSIIGVMTAVRVLQNSIESGLSDLGAHTFQIQKTPRFANRKEWLKAMARKDITYQQAKMVEDRMTLAEYVGIEGGDGGYSLHAGDIKTNPDVEVYGETNQGFPTNNWTIKEGRLFSESELSHEQSVAILGDAVVKKLFPNGNAVGSHINIGDLKFKVIGTVEPKGAALGGNQDNFVILPLQTFLDKFGKHQSLHIMIESKTQQDYEDAMDEARFILRTIRNVPPADPDDFYIFSNDSVISTFNDFTFYVKMGVGFISFIALLAAGVGVMNIMLVSVTERTKEIGIRKAIGALKSTILGQFVVEAIVLCQFGGIVGIVLGIIAGNLVALAFHVPAVFPFDWALIGFALCALIGVAFGVYPAWKAASLDPIVALRFE
ncbi:MAG TPA: ABC transporter permease [Bacteroidota bacterium]